jgi:serine protease
MMKKILRFISVVFFMFIFMSFNVPGATVSDQDFKTLKLKGNSENRPAYVEDEIIVVFQESVRGAIDTTLTRELGLIKKEQKRHSGRFCLYKKGKFEGDIDAVIKRIKTIPGVSSVERNGIAYAMSVPNDPYYQYQWNMTRLGLENVWGYCEGAGATVAIIDTGVKQTISDFGSTNFVSGYDFVNNDNDPDDDNGHGTFLAGIVAQSTNNGIGVAGIAYQSSIMPVKVLDANGSGSYSNIANGIFWATDNGADVINLSLGGSYNSPILEAAVNYAWNNGVLITCSVSSSGSIFYPAAYTNTIGVNATNYSNNLASYASACSYVDIAAPGGDFGDSNGDGIQDMILQQDFNGSFTLLLGNSFASAHVAGVVAIMKSVNPALTAGQIRLKLFSSAIDLGTAGFDNEFGWGLVNAEAAMQSANVAPVADFTTSITGTSVQFTDTSTDSNGTVVAWLWVFGDGGRSLDQNPVHNYLSSGTYNVILQVTDNHGAVNYKTSTVSVQ